MVKKKPEKPDDEAKNAFWSLSIELDNRNYKNVYAITETLAALLRQQDCGSLAKKIEAIPILIKADRADEAHMLLDQLDENFQ